jgi:ATP-dependent Clp protease ATP-binding subunit ClpA
MEKEIGAPFAIFFQKPRKALHRALAYANDRNHEYATLEHLLLSLIDDQDALSAVMKACNVDLDQAAHRQRLSRHRARRPRPETMRTPSRPPGFQRVIQRAVIHVQSSGREEVTGANVLVAIFAERESHAAYFLQSRR